MIGLVWYWCALHLSTAKIEKSERIKANSFDFFILFKDGVYWWFCQMGGWKKAEAGTRVPASAVWM